MHVNRIDEIDESLAGSEFVVRNNVHLPDPLNVHAHALMRGSRSNCWKRRGGEDCTLPMHQRWVWTGSLALGR